MRIGIVTQPLGHNYGGILQNYALQQVLQRLGHKPVTIYHSTRITWLGYILSTIKSILLFPVPSKRRKFIKSPLSDQSNRTLHSFIQQKIHLTFPIIRYNWVLPFLYRLESVIVGSDQVWRPKYNCYIQDMYLQFVKGKKCKKIAYAASFGVDTWEYTDELTKQCKRLATRLDAISVREHSGIKLCKDYLDVNAVEVLDPTLMLSSEDYSLLCGEVDSLESPFIAAYILDVDEHKMQLLKEFSSRKSLELRLFTADEGLTLTVEQWLAMFRDASFVITDSFHGTVFSIINHTDFISIVNSDRGSSRFESLLDKFNLQDRLISSYDYLPDMSNIDWDNVDKVLASWRNQSIDFLTTALNKNNNG